MQPPILVVSNPPHGKVDHAEVATILGLEDDNARLKCEFPAPELLHASNAERAAEVAAALRGTGMRVAVFDGSALAAVPWPRPARSFGFAESALVADVHDRPVEVPYDRAVVGVYCRPPAEFTVWTDGYDDSALAPETDGSAVAEAIEWMAILDLYVEAGGVLSRVSIVEDLVDFSGLGDQRGTSRAGDMAVTLAQCEARFERFRLDSRLENVRPRQRFVGGETGFDVDLRKNYSYGTLLLRHALESISPELRDLTQYELGSRLGYVLTAAADDG